MRSLKRIICAVYFGFFIMLSSTGYSHAYVDPATTSYLIQIIAGVFIAAGASVAVFWRKISFWFKKRKAARARRKKEQRNK